MKNMENLYWEGVGIPKDYETAQNNLGICYYKGIGCKKYAHKALYWFMESSKGGYANGESSVAEVYYYGY